MLAMPTESPIACSAEAGRLWQWPEYVALLWGRATLWRSAAQSLRKLPGLG